MAPHRDQRGRFASVTPENEDPTSSQQNPQPILPTIEEASNEGGQLARRSTASYTPDPGNPNDDFTPRQKESIMAMLRNVISVIVSQELNKQSANQNPPPDPPPDPPPPTNISFTPPAKQLRAEDVGYFDPGYKHEEDTSPMKAKQQYTPVVSVGKHVYYIEVYTFVDRLKDLAVSHGEQAVAEVLTSCLRGESLMWFSMELTDSERKELRQRGLNLMCMVMIERFKMRAFTALSHLIGSRYGLAQLRSIKPRAWAMQMRYFAKAAAYDSTYNQLTTMWNQLDVQLRLHIPEPEHHTSLAVFLDQLDAKTSIWEKMADRQQRQHQHQQYQQRAQYQPHKQQRYQQRYQPIKREGQDSNTNTKPPSPTAEKGNAYLAEEAPENEDAEGFADYCDYENEYPVN